MRIAILGAGAVGCFLAARLVRGGRDVRLLARGQTLAVLRDRPLLVESPLGKEAISVPVEAEPAALAGSDLLLVTVKSPDLPALLPDLALAAREPKTAVLTFLNGVDAPEVVAKAVRPEQVLAGAAYVSVARPAPGLVRQSGAHARFVFGEFAAARPLSARARAFAELLAVPGLETEAVADARVALWEKLLFLAPLSGFTAAARAPLGKVWHEAGESRRAVVREAVREVARVARACGVPLAMPEDPAIDRHLSTLPPDVRSSMLHDLEAGRPLELPDLHGAVVRRGRERGVPVPVLETLLAVLAPHQHGALHA